MPFTTISTVQLQPARPVSTDLMNALYNRDEDLNVRVGSASELDITNGSFEVLSGTAAAGWTITVYTGGAVAVDTSIVAHGAKSLKMTHPGGAGNGGGEAESEAFLVSSAKQFTIGYQIKTNATGARNKVIIRPLDKNLTTLADVVPYNKLSSVDGTAAWASTYTTFTPPSSATFAKIVLQGGTTDANPGAVANTYFDNITVMSKSKIKSVMLETSSASIKGLTSTVGTAITNISMSDFSFSPNVYSTLHPHFTRMCPSRVSTGDNIARFGFNTFGSTYLIAPSSYEVHYRYITASEGYKAALFYDSSGAVRAKYRFGNAPKNYIYILEDFKKGNDYFSYELVEDNSIYETTPIDKTKRLP